MHVSAPKDNKNGFGFDPYLRPTIFLRLIPELTAIASVSDSLSLSFLLFPTLSLNSVCTRMLLQDACVEAFHRTAVHHLLPYTPRYDNFSIWMSAIITNIAADLIITPYCMLFNQIIVQESLQKHDEYPHEMKTQSFLQKHKGYSHVLKNRDSYRQGMAFVAKLHRSKAVRERAKTVKDWRTYLPGKCFSMCLRMPKQINYIELFEKILKKPAPPLQLDVKDEPPIFFWPIHFLSRHHFPFQLPIAQRQSGSVQRQWKTGEPTYPASAFQCASGCRNR